MNGNNWLDAIIAIKEAISLIKVIIPKFPRNSKEQEIIQKLNEAEERLKRADAKLAEELGYPLCKCTFPPQIMLEKKEKKLFKCPECGKEEKFESTIGAYGKLKSTEFWNNH